MNQQLFTQWLEAARQSKEDVIVSLVQTIIQNASKNGVSDLHFQPDQEGTEIWYRFNGVLHELGRVDSQYSSQLTARLKVLANLLTYRTTTPQEGRVQAGRVLGVANEMRISTMPTLFGERVVIRFFAEESKYQFPDQLGLPATMEHQLISALSKSGAIIICGPAGSGKTTTAYSLLRHLAIRSEGLRSIITLEDPIEHPLPRTAQIEISSQGEITLPAMIKYTMRQDPEVLFVGEIRDQPSAAAAFQAALTGHVLLTTFHAGSAAEAVGRLSEMGIEPFVLRSSIGVVLCQRLLRSLCDCAKETLEPTHLSFANQTEVLNKYRSPVGCDRCSQTGYQGRTVIAELIPWNDAKVSQAVLNRQDTVTLERIAVEAGMKTIFEQAIDLVRQGVTSPQELHRVLGR